MTEYAREPKRTEGESKEMFDLRYQLWIVDCRASDQARRNLRSYGPRKWGELPRVTGYRGGYTFWDVS